MGFCLTSPLTFHLFKTNQILEGGQRVLAVEFGRLQNCQALLRRKIKISRLNYGHLQIQNLKLISVLSLGSHNGAKLLSKSIRQCSVSARICKLRGGVKSKLGTRLSKV